MDRSPLPPAAPFWMSLALIPLLAWAAWAGGAWWLAVPAYAWAMTTLLDRVLGLAEGNPDPETGDERLFWKSPAEDRRGIFLRV